MLTLAFAVAILPSLAYCQAWDDLKVTFGMNPISSSYFVPMARTMSEAAGSDFARNTDCDVAKNHFAGIRYARKDGDNSVFLLYDIQGTIAGIQTRVPKSTGYPTAKGKQFQNYWVEEGDANLLTAYFVDPRTVCTKGRPNNDLNSEGTGTGLYLQIGSASSDAGIQFEEIPKEESGMSATKWTKGKCFVFMGQHYWYNMRQDMDCDDFKPYFILYNSGKLDGFGFAMSTKMEGKYYEHPTVGVAGSFFPFTPKCFNEPSFPQTFSTVHIYMYKRPWTKLCIF